MSTGFNLTPTQTQLPPTGATNQPPAPTGPAPKPAPSTGSGNRKKNNTPAPPGTPTDGTLGGVVIPGAALTGFISICWLIHQFGLPAVLIGICALAATATTALVLKARGKRRKSPARRAALKSAGRGSPGARGGGGAGTAVKAGRAPSSLNSTGPSRRAGAGPRPAGAGRTTAAKGPTAARPTPSRKAPRPGASGGSPSERKPTGAASQKPAGMTSAKNRPSTAGTSGKKNTLPRTAGGALGKKAAALGGRGTNRPTKPSNKTAGGGNKNSRPQASLPKQTRPGSLKKTQPSTKKTKTPTTLRKTNGPAPSAPGKHRRTGSGNKPGTAPTGRHGRLSRIRNRRTNAPVPPATAKGHNKTRPTRAGGPQRLKAWTRAVRSNRTNRPRTSPRIQHLKAKAKIPAGLGRRAARRFVKAARPATRNKLRQRTTAGLRRGAYLVGVKARRHVPYRTRAGIRRVTTPTRNVLRKTISRPAAHLWRHGTRAVLAAHMLLGTIRYTNAGPNWVRPIARLMHAMTSPAARLLAATGSWSWLNQWMYRNTTNGPQTTSTPGPAAPQPATVAPAAPVGPVHQHIPSPTVTVSSPKGSPVSISSAMPLIHAAEAVRQAGVMLLINPADNMRGYEATMSQLADVQSALGQVIAAAAMSTRENFKVNPAISDAYDDTAGYAHSIAQRLDSIPALYRMVHAEQIDNIENPTPQGAKWDQTANND